MVRSTRYVPVTIKTETHQTIEHVNPCAWAFAQLYEKIKLDSAGAAAVSGQARASNLIL
jgi:hypothetical protein